MCSAPKSIHDRDTQAFFRECFGYDKIEPCPIEFPQLAKKICRSFAQVARGAEASRFNEGL
jgi:hypothetical protein